MTRELAVPALSLVVLVGTSGSGKSTFARTHFRPTEVVSSDACRAMVADDENDQTATPQAFELLHDIVDIRLRTGRLTVIDATNVQPESRRALVALAREHDVLPVAIVLDVPEPVCLARNARRPDRQFGPQVIRRQHDQLRRGRKGLGREGFRTVHTLRGEAEVADVAITRTRLFSDRTDQTGPFDVIGDIHGCGAELETLLTRLDYRIERDEQGRPVGAHHDRRRAVFLGDLVDRGPDTPGVLRLVMGMVAAGNALCVSGNHEAKLLKALRGRNVARTHGLAETLDQLAAERAEFRAEVEAFLDGLIGHYMFDGGRLVVAHAGLLQRYQGRASARVREFCLYGQTTGETDEFGLPVRYPWAQEYRGPAMVLYGHTPTAEPEWVNHTLCLDTGCVFGGRLSALRYPERELVSVPARGVHYEPAKPFPTGTPTDAAIGPPNVPVIDGHDPAERDADVTAIARRDPDVLRIADVAGTRVVQTRHAGRIKVQAENAAAALEVMSRFALDPRWLLYLPPTMSPVATSARADLLEHPDEAFGYFRDAGVAQVVAQEKHMGSRAVVLLARTPAAAADRFGIGGLVGEHGAVWTRTGRSFFPPAVADPLLEAIRAAAERSGLFDELGSSWLLLDTELMPWSAKAGPLIREQYAAVGAAARAELPAAVELLERAAAGGLPVGELLARTRSRRENAEAFSRAYRRYCWPTDGITGIAVAPFAVLAAQGSTFEDRPQCWHLAAADALAAAAPGLIVGTSSILVDTGDAESMASAIRWWTELTEGGGEGMVVKPAANLVRGRHGLVQPGLKVRGREYLRLVYGPDYTEPANLERLRSRGLGHKRSLALRECALGLEGLHRAAQGEPLWRVHECVFAVLALESEPVDPRL